MENKLVWPARLECTVAKLLVVYVGHQYKPQKPQTNRKTQPAQGSEKPQNTSACLHCYGNASAVGSSLLDNRDCASLKTATSSKFHYLQISQTSYHITETLGYSALEYMHIRAILCRAVYVQYSR